MRTKLRHLTDVTDRQWRAIESLVPERPGGSGRRPKHAKREVVNAILYYLHFGGSSWRTLPEGFPPWQTVYGYFREWRKDGTLDRLHERLGTPHRGEGGPVDGAGSAVDLRLPSAVDRAPGSHPDRHGSEDASGRSVAQLRYATDVTDREWKEIESLVPEVSLGRRPKHAKREVVNAILYYLHFGGSSWRTLPEGFPPWQTVYGYFRQWRKDGTLDRLHERLGTPLPGLAPAGAHPG